LRWNALGWMTKGSRAAVMVTGSGHTLISPGWVLAVVVSRGSTRPSRAGFGEFFLDRHLGPTEFDHEALAVEGRDASDQILAGVIRHASRGDGRRIRLGDQGLNGDDDADLTLV